MFNSVQARVAAAIQSRLIRALVREEKGATAVEYGLIVGLIAVALIVAIGLLSGALQNLFGSITDALDGAATP